MPLRGARSSARTRVVQFFPAARREPGVGHVHPGQALHERPGLQQPGVLHNPHERVKVRNDLKGAEHQRVALQEPPRARRQRAAVFRADRAGPNHVEVPVV